MSLKYNLDNAERKLLLEVIRESLSVRNHFELYHWLQGKFQIFLPHETMIAAWGDFSLGSVQFDIVSSLLGIRTKRISQNELSPLLKRLFIYWESQNKNPLVIDIKKELFKEDVLKNDFSNNFSNMRSVVVHGIKDCRDLHDCLYIMMYSKLIPAPSSRIFETLLPYIDCTLRQIEHLPEQLPECRVNKDSSGRMVNTLLSPREIEIMDWVNKGKTNVEIGMILDISVFTVKNHLHRIFKKLEVFNRAQAASSYKKAIQD